VVVSFEVGSHLNLESNAAYANFPLSLLKHSVTPHPPNLMNTHFQLPSYLDKSPEVEQRFQKIRNRPVVLDVQGLGKTFKSRNEEVVALEDLNFQVHRREFICVIGPSGCGKSTLVRTIAGLETHTHGKLLLDGKPIAGPGPDRGMVFQAYTLFPWLTVRKNVMFGLQMTGQRRTAENESLQWLDLVGLSDFADAYPHQLSGGMKQRVAIARTLANRPRILLMDEPFGALDAQTRAQMQSYLLQLWQNIDITILFITHDLDEATYLADRIIVLSSQPGHIKELIEVPVPRPRHPDQFISPEFIATKKRLEYLIHPPEAREIQPLPIIKMTRVGDEVD
jgi:NitT/TauT family transport system ATP-binding protein